MQITFDDDHGNRVTLECSELAVIRDPEYSCWAVVCTEATTGRGVIIRADLDMVEAHEIHRILRETGQYLR